MSNASPPVRGPVLFLMGPTASGKTGLALALAERFPVEILNADSVQVYRGLTIGAAKPTPAEMARAPHHLFDLVAADEPFSAGRYREAALAVMAGCQRRGTLPLLVGGSGLYFRAVERGFVEVPPPDAALVAAIREEGARLGWPALHRRLAQGDPPLAARIQPTDSQRITRGLAVLAASGRPLSQWQAEQPPPAPFPLLKMALAWPREQLYARIDQRFDRMLADGLLDEVARLRDQGLARELPAMKAVGYRQLLLYLDGACALAEAVALAKRESRRYAKRQLTWLRREPELHWLDAAHPGVAAVAVALVGRFLRGERDFT